MASDDTAAIAPPERVATGIAGLDAVLGGGLFAGSLYIVQGGPGTGKTILANQIGFHLARLGRRVAYLTLLGEPHDRMLQHLAALDFTDLSLLPHPLSYVSAYGALEDDGLSGLLALVRDTMRRRSPYLLVMDGLYVAQEQSGSTPEFRRFVHALQGEAGLHGCTMLFLSNSPDATTPGPERTMVDGLIELRDDLVEARAVRSLHVRKLRGGAFLRGRHAFRIRDEGIVVFPRLEALAEPPPAATAAGHRDPTTVSTGVHGLDRMLRGGVPAGSTTLVAGPSGSGKTTVGLLFLGQSTPEAPGLLFGCNEPPDELRQKARSIGIEFDGLVGSGALSVVWQPPHESLLDEMGHRLLGEVRRTGARRVLIDDGVASFRQAMISPGRLQPFFTALSRGLHAEGASTVCTTEARELFTPRTLLLDEVSAVADNLLLLRLAERRSRLLRLLSVVKVRQSGFDPSVVPFEIGDRGITLGEPPANADAVTGGAARRA